MAGAAMIEALGEAGGKSSSSISSRPSRACCASRVSGKSSTPTIGGQSRGKIEIVADLPGGGQEGPGLQSAEDALQGPPRPRRAFRHQRPSALGAGAAVEKAGKAGKIKLIGFDGQPEGKQAIKDGKIYADPIQFPDQIGTRTMQTIVAYFEAAKKFPPKSSFPRPLSSSRRSERCGAGNAAAALSAPRTPLLRMTGIEKSFAGSPRAAPRRSRHCSAARCWRCSAKTGPAKVR